MLQVTVAFSIEDYEQQQQQQQQLDLEGEAASSSAQAPPQAQAHQAGAQALGRTDQLESGINWPSFSESPPFWKRPPRHQALNLGELPSFASKLDAAFTESAALDHHCSIYVQHDKLCFE